MGAASGFDQLFTCCKPRAHAMDVRLPLTLVAAVELQGNLQAAILPPARWGLTGSHTCQHPPRRWSVIWNMGQAQSSSIVETGNDSLRDLSSRLQGVEKTILDEWLGNSSLSPDIRKISVGEVLKTVAYTYDTLLETDQNGNYVNSDIHVQILQTAVEPVVLQACGDFVHDELFLPAVTGMVSKDLVTLLGNPSGSAQVENSLLTVNPDTAGPFRIDYLLAKHSPEQSGSEGIAPDVLFVVAVVHAVDTKKVTQEEASRAFDDTYGSKLRSHSDGVIYHGQALFNIWPYISRLLPPSTVGSRW